MKSVMKLYDFQEECVDQILTGFAKHRVQCLAWYTGAGKTNIIAELCKLLIDNPNVRIGISAYLTTEIRDQIALRLKTFGLSEHVYMVVPGAPVDTSRRIAVFNPQGLHNKKAKFTFDYLIVDESHVGLAEDCTMIRKIIANHCNKKTRILLVSATPWDELAMKEFAGAPVYKRPLDQGLKDGLITDFRFHAEEAMITFKEEDFNRSGDLGRSAAMKSMAILKSACMGKVEYIRDNYDKELGRKVLVICPPGNFTEIPRTLAEHFGGLTFVQTRQIDVEGEHRTTSDETKHLEQFRTDPNIRFLFVANKCQVGFDMPELTSVIDLTMSRNVRVLAQRCGRVARKHGDLDKHYFYVYDQSLMKDRLEWLVATMIDFCLGAYDGWTTKTAKYRKLSVSGHSNWLYRSPFSTTLSEVTNSLRNDNLIHNVRTLSWVTAGGPPTVWTLERAIATANTYSSRTEMWEKRPALYKWFRLNAKPEMDRIFPLKHHLNRWNEKTVIEAMKISNTRLEFRTRFSGAYAWCSVHERADLKEKYLPGGLDPWSEERAMRAMASIKKWTDVRNIGGVRNWMRKNGGEAHWRALWVQMTPAEAASYKRPDRVSKKRPPRAILYKKVQEDRKKLRAALDQYKAERARDKDKSA